MLRHRPATTLADLALAGTVMSRAWSAGASLVAASPAGIEWWYASSWPDALADHLRLWWEAAPDEAGEDVPPVAWSWHDSGELEWHASTGEPARDVEVFREILTTAIREAAGLAVGTWTAEDDASAIALLRELGFAPATTRLSQWRSVPGGVGIEGDTDPHANDADPLPAGYRIRSLRGPEDIPARVDVHRAAFAPSRLSVEKYERLITAPHYRFEDDLVVEAPDGTFAAFAMAWWDPIGRIGEFEPVGTHPDHQRRGLARALLRHGLRRFTGLGAGVVQVYSDATNPASEALYEAAGFRRRAYHRRYERPAQASAATTERTTRA